jgi:Rhomboid-like protein
MTLFDGVHRLGGQSAVIALRREAATGCDPRHMTMLSVVLSRLVSVRVTAAYAVVLAVIGGTLLALGPSAQSAVVSRMSTNLYNLADGHLATLVASAFVTDGDDIYFLLPGLVCLLALGELAWRGRGVILAFAVGHVGATLLVAVGLVVAIGAGWLPISVAHASDVGISYGAAAVLGGLTTVIPRRWRPAWIGWWLATALVAASTADFTAVGHLLALMLGMGLSRRLGSTTGWTVTRVALLVIGVAFGYLMITGSSLVTMVVAGTAGALVALTAQWAAQPRRLRRPRHLVSINATQIARDEETLAPPALDIAHRAVERTANHNRRLELAA